MHLRVNYLRLLLRATYLVEQLLVPTPLKAFYLYRDEHTQYPASQTHTARVFHKRGQRGLSPYCVCSFTYWSSYYLYIYFCIYTLPTCSASSVLVIVYGVFIRQRSSYIVGYSAARPTYSFIYTYSLN